MRVACIVAGFLLAAWLGRVGSAAAAPATEPDPAWGWSTGLNLRTELGTHPIRAGLGVRWQRLAVGLVLDPMFWTDGQHDIDLHASRDVTRQRVAVLVGARTTIIPLFAGRQYQHKLLLGVQAPVASLSRAWLATTVGVELATVVVKHGGGLPTDWLSFAEPVGYVDLINFALFVRFDYCVRCR